MSLNSKTTQFSQPESEAPHLKIVDGKIIDPFDDLQSLMCRQDFSDSGGAKKLLTRVPVRRPRVLDWFMVNPDPDYYGDFSLCEDRDENETFLVAPTIAEALDGEPTLHDFTIFTAVTRSKTVFLFPVRRPGRDGKWNSWHRSQQDAAKRAMCSWVRMTANKDIGGYDLREGTFGNFTNPDWADLPPFRELVKIAFRDFLIDSVDHLHLKRLRGQV
jgi:hypothetical protein